MTHGCHDCGSPNSCECPKDNFAEEHLKAPPGDLVATEQCPYCKGIVLAVNDTHPCRRAFQEGVALAAGVHEVATRRYRKIAETATADYERANTRSKESNDQLWAVNEAVRDLQRSLRADKVVTVAEFLAKLTVLKGFL